MKMYRDGKPYPDDNTALDSTNIEDDSIHDYFHEGVGESVTKEITLAADGTTASVNIFQLTGSVEIVSIRGFVTDATTLADCDGASLDLWDSTAAVQITKNDGDIGGMGVGTLLVKNAGVGTTIGIADPVAGAVTEAAAGVKSFFPFFITQKTSANTYVRFTYTTTDSPIAATISWKARYRPQTHGAVSGTLVAV